MEIVETLRMDEVPEDRRPACPTCSHTMRRNLDTGVWSCDLHGRRVPLWVPRVTA